MKILFDYQIFSLQEFGGISRYYAELARRLPRLPHGIETAVLAPLHINSYLKTNTIPVRGVKVPAFPGKHRILQPLNWLFSEMALAGFRPDIIHETYYHRWASRHTIPRILTVYDMIHERYPRMFTGYDRGVAQHKAAAVARADHVIAISEATKNDLMHFLEIDEGKISVIPLASAFTPPAQNQRATAPVFHHPYLLYVGLRGGVKNFATLLQVFAASPFLHQEHDLLCAGGGEFTQQERRQIAAAGLQDKVKQVAGDDALLQILYAGAELFVYPSLYEGFGLPLLEAMRCGCPVACSNTSSMPEIGGDAVCYFAPEEPDSLQAALEKMIQSASYREELKKRGHLRAKMFSWERCVEETATVYLNNRLI